jgi:hypothetical protein
MGITALILTGKPVAEDLVLRSAVLVAPPVAGLAKGFSPSSVPGSTIGDSSSFSVTRDHPCSQSLAYLNSGRSLRASLFAPVSSSFLS